MQNEVKFKKLTFATGRNGLMKCSGINLLNINSGVMMSPLTSKGVIGRCDIVIDYGSLFEVIQALRRALIEHNASK
jgi:hypothetical protein